MALTGKLFADFAPFEAAVHQAEISLKGFEQGAGKVEISLDRVANSLSGTKLIQDATVMAEAVDRVGGVSTLTARELARVGAQATEAAAKLTAMGQEVPPGIQRIADAAAHADGSMAGMAMGASKADEYFKIFSGDATKGMMGLGIGIKETAQAMTDAVAKMGGASALTAKDQLTVNKTVTEAIAHYTALGQHAPPAMMALADATKNVGTATRTTTGFLTDLSGGIVGVAAGFVSAQAVIGAATAAYHQLSQFVGESVQAFAQAEAADVKLVAALRQHSVATPEVIAQYKELGGTFQQTTKYSDDQIIAMEALLTQVGGLMPSAMAGALKASTDLASGLGIDLQSATTLVAKAAAGHTETLGRYGITVSAAALETKGFAAVLEAINRQFGGQAAADLETYAGKVTQIENSWNNLQEMVGHFVVENEFAVASLRALKNATEDADQASAHAAPSVAGFIGALGGDELGIAVALMEGYVSHLNDAARFTKQMSDVPSPFAKMAADGALPAITAGMKLFNEQVVESEKAHKAAAEALAKFGVAMVEINAVGVGWKGTLDTIDGTVVESIKYYLQAGVAQDKLATAYGLTAAQVKSVASELTSANERTKAATAETDKAAAATAHWAELMGNLTAVGGGWQGTLDTIDGTVVEAVKFYLEAGVAQNTLAEAYGLTEAQVKAVAKSMTEGQAVHTKEAKAVVDLTSLVHTLAGEYISAAEAKKRFDMGGSFDVTTANIESVAKGFGIDSGRLIALLHQGYSVDQARQIVRAQEQGGLQPVFQNPGPRVPGFAEGVANFAGGLARVHKDELLVNLSPGTNVIPFGRSGGGATSVRVDIREIKVSGVLDPRTIRELSQSLGDEIMRTLKSGRLLGSA